MAESTAEIGATEYPSNPNLQAAGETVSILAQIHEGALLQFQSLQIPRVYAVAATDHGRALVVGGERGVRGNPTFVVTRYSYSPEFNRAKISLRSNAEPVGFWAPGKSSPGLTNPLVIDPQVAGELNLADTGNGISIQNPTGTAPFYQLVTEEQLLHLAYGFKDTGGQAGLFNISIVG